MTACPRIVAYLDELPKTATGKIDRQALLRSVASPCVEGSAFAAYEGGGRNATDLDCR
jgi:acyl-coenzyme A synthetase/AMP-(fatty) acid ligase